MDKTVSPAPMERVVPMVPKEHPEPKVATAAKAERDTLSPLILN